MLWERIYSWTCSGVNRTVSGRDLDAGQFLFTDELVDVFTPYAQNLSHVEACQSACIPESVACSFALTIWTSVTFGTQSSFHGFFDNECPAPPGPGHRVELSHVNDSRASAYHRV